MSRGTFGHARRTLDIIDEQKLEADHIEKLHDGYLVDLARAIKKGLLPSRPDFQKMLGLLPELKIWKTVKLGLRKSPAEYRTALKAAGYGISNYADQILEKISVAKTGTEVNLARMTVAELGFKVTTRYGTICKRVIEVGGQIDDSGEVGPALREQYPDQPSGEWNTVAMKAIAGSDGDLCVFDVVRDRDGRWLVTHCGDPDSLFGPGGRIVFVVPRK